jgi:hypothetical protein
MTVLTPGSLLPFVRIVLGMAGVAGRLQLNFEYGLYVAINAFERCVGAADRVVGITGMVESNITPGDVGMTIIAASTVVPVVDVVFDMTTCARRLQIVRKGFVPVTITAGKIGVTSQ